MSEITSLLARAEKYLSSAKLLLDSGDFESSVSRSYYAMFFAAEAALLSLGLSFSSHRGVLSTFGEHFTKTGRLPKELIRELYRAFEKRQLGDYESVFVITREEAGGLLESAKGFIKAVKEVLPANS